MRVYLAAQYARKAEIAEYARQLNALGHEVVSTWTDEPYSPTVQLAEVSEQDLREIAERDINEVLRSDALVLFSVSDKAPTYRNGRLVEFGIALALDKRLLVCGPRENIFHHLSDVEVYPDWETVKRALSR